MSSIDSNQGLSFAFLRESVTCPVCLSVPKEPPVFNCSRGHIICQPCSRTLRCPTRCPTCRIAVDRWGESLLAKRIIENIPHSCPYDVFGCIFQGLNHELKDHVTSCPFRSVHCPYRECSDSKVTLSELKKHFLANNCVWSSRHPFTVPLMNQRISIEADSWSWGVKNISFDGCEFFLSVTFVDNTEDFYFYVTVDKNREDAKKYKASIWVAISSSPTSNSFSLTGDVLSIDDYPENLEESRRIGGVFKINGDLLKYMDGPLSNRDSLIKIFSTLKVRKL